MFIAFFHQHRRDANVVVFFDGVEVIGVHVSAVGNEKIPRDIPTLRCPAIVASAVMLFGVVLYPSRRPELHGYYWLHSIVRNSIKIASTSFIGLLALNLLVSTPAHAHCPLCTAGAGVVALGAAKLGVGPMSVGIFLGAFAVALGLWVARFLKKQYVPRQKMVLAILSFATTIFPLQVVLTDYSSVYLPFWGEFGKTLLINLFVVGGIIGGVLMLLSPYLSRKLALARDGEMYPFQGMVITLVLLGSAAVVIELSV